MESEQKITPTEATNPEVLDPVNNNPATNSTSSKSKKDEKDLKSEIRSLKNQLKGMEILLKQNNELEKEVERLCNELDTVSMGVQKSGYLYKWREREIYFASKWGLRYFVLHKNQLSYYGDEHERRPRRTIDLSKCVVKDEGTKKNGLYNVFSLYLRDDSMEDVLVLRLSSDNSADANQWIDMLEQGCSLDQAEELARHVSDASLSLRDLNVTDGDGDKKAAIGDENAWTNTPLELDESDPALLSTVMLTRVKSANLTLNKSKSRQLLHQGNGSSASVSPVRQTSVTQRHKAGEALIAASTENLRQPSLRKVKDKRVIKSFPAYKPMHISNNPSPLSSETRPGEYNYRGFFNLMVIILGITHCDLIVNNISKYGVKFNLVSFIRPPEAVLDLMEGQDIKAFETSSILFHFTKAVLTWVVSIGMNYSLEKYASQNPVNEKLILVLNFLIGSFNIIVPCYWVWTSKGHPGLNSAYIFQSVIIWMKLISYAHANKDLRVASRRNKKFDRADNDEIRSGYSSGDDLSLSSDNLNQLSNNPSSKPYQYLTVISEVKDIETPILLYPQNITLRNLGYFLIVPTLCYQLNYPRTDRIKYDKLFFIIFRLIVVAFAMLFAIEQYIKPTLETAVVPMSEGDILGIAERLLKLSIPNTYVWLLMFYFYFHLWLNMLAEITRFGDRMFYKDWWNARTIDRYWWVLF